MVILDPGVPAGEASGTYPPFEEGDRLGVWVLNSTGDPLFGINCRFLYLCLIF